MRLDSAYDLLDTVRKLDRKYRITFIATILTGLFAQGMGIFNKYSVNDDSMNFGVGYTYTSGRWMLDILSFFEEKLFGDIHYSLSTFNGMISLVFIALAACLLINILDLENIVFCAFTGSLMVCFPVVTSIFGYMYTLHYYMFSLLCGVLGAYFVCKKDQWHYWVSGIVLMASSVGIYQAFIPFTISVLLMYLIKYVYSDNCSGKNSMIMTGRVGGSAVMFMLFYFVVNKIYLFIMKAELSGYRGVDTMGKLPVKEYISRGVEAYRLYINGDCFAHHCMYPAHMLYIYFIVLAASFALSVFLGYRLAKADILKAIVFFALVLLFPLCVNFIIVMVEYEKIHSLMVYSSLLPFVYFVWLLEQIEFKHFKKLISYAVVAMLIFIITMYCRIDNKCYLQATYIQQESITYFTSLITQIKSVEGYDDELPVVFINPTEKRDESLNDIEEFYTIGYLPYDFRVEDYINNYRWLSYIHQWCGYEPVIAEEDDFKDLEEVKNMPHYPDDGSIKIINDTVVVNF